MSEKEKKELENEEEVVELEEEELDNVSGGRGGLNPPRVDVYEYDSDVKKRM